MSREEAQDAIATSDAWLDTNPVAIATQAQAKATFYVGEQLERIADLLNGGFAIERTDSRTEAWPLRQER